MTSRCPLVFRIQPRTPARAGFALLVTIVLVAFLVLVLVGLASFTRVETQVAANSQSQAQARQNALMALNLALGELQKYTGPDQRTTARSDMSAALAHTTTASGRWLGAYGNGAVSDYTQPPSAVSAAIVAASDSRGSQAKLLNWLVSGNEGTAFDSASHVGARGEISTPPTEFLFTPQGAVSGLGTGSVATSDTITIADRNGAARPARLLIGGGTAGDAAEDYVVAPLRDIEAETPGRGDAPVAVGRYAWWIGDEGMKARANLPMADAAQTPAAFASASRAAVELMDRVNPSVSASLASAQMLDPSGTNALYDPSANILSRVRAPNQFSMIGSTPGAASALRTAARYRYHDLTYDSFGVLSDTYAGGLKKDLSATLAEGASNPADTDFLFPVETSAGARAHFTVPTWGLLRDHVRTTAGSGGIAPRPPGMVKLPALPSPIPSTIGISPVLTYAAAGFAYGVPQDAPAPFDQAGNSVKLAIFPVVVLWNPYTVALQPARYEIGFRKHTNGRFELQVRNPDDTDAWAYRHIAHRGDLDSFNGSNDRYLRFVIDNSEGIPAGQSLVFTLRDSGGNYSPANAANPLVHAYNIGNHVVVETGVVIGQARPFNPAEPAIQPGATWRVGVKGASHNATQALIANTFFSAAAANFGGNDPHEVYLGEFNAAAPVPAPGSTNTNYPFTTAFASRRWHQAVSQLTQYYDSAPYGSNHGYAVNNAANGLFRNPDAISLITFPTFRLAVLAGFKESRERWLAQGNPRALLSTRSSGNFSSTNYRPFPLDSGTWPTSLNVVGVTDPLASAGISLKHTGPSPVEARLFEIRPDNQPFLSVGQLQHANLSWSGGTPGYAVGNSLLDPTLDGAPHQLFRAVAPGSWEGPAALFGAHYDFSWLLNRTLWDRYFVSTVPHAGTGLPTDTSDANTDIPPVLANPRHVRLGEPSDTELRDPDRASAHLMLAGGFNINSTSEQAWRAVLGGVNRLVYDPVNGSTTASPLRAALSRFSRPADASPAAINTDNAWTGYRVLTEEQIARLARDIVAEIRARGPFVSLADFVNRRLVDSGPYPQNNDKRLKGVIQAALDATTTGSDAVNNASLDPFAATTTPLVTDSIANNAFTRASKSGAALNGVGARVAPFSSPSAFAPQFVTQADILSAIGSGLAARSDTFVIRAYGETINPALPSGDPARISARAWCEAVVQRTPDYLDSAADPDPAQAATDNTNRRLGRRYQVVSFRWLGPDDV